MILKTKDEILNWLKKYDGDFEKNIQNNAYEFIDMHDIMNSSLLKELIKKDNLALDYFEELKSEGHQYIVNVNGNCNIYFGSLEKILIQFYHVDGFFACSHNRLTSLKGFPQYVGGDFYCSHNRLTSLEYGPQSVGGEFSCSHNQLTSLEYCPKSIGGNFYCEDNQLISFRYCPQSVGGDFTCFNNKLTSLKYSPQHINGYFFCSNNQLISLEYFPEIVTKGVYLQNNEKLLKYKKDSNDIHIQKMSDDEFLDQRNLSFWKQLHLIEKIMKENSKIIDDLDLNEKQENNQFIKKI